MPAAVARRTRYDTPKWAADILGDNPGPAEFDRVHSHHEARKLPRETNPDSIDDPDVRDAFLEQQQNEFDDDYRRARATGHADSASSPRRSSPSSGRGFSLPVPASFGSALAGLVLYAVAVNYVRGGSAQLRRWTSAKFTNGGGRLA